MDMEITYMNRSQFLTDAILLDGGFSDDFADVVAEPSDDRIVAGLKSGYTKALFNACVAAKDCSDSAGIMSLLVSINRNLLQPDNWQVVEEGKTDLETTLLLIQIELLESACFFGGEAVPILSAAMATLDDALHFAVLNGVQATVGPEFIPMLQHYQADLPQMPVHEDSKPYLLDAVSEAIDTCESNQLV